jgi:hypothetical protein
VIAATISTLSFTALPAPAATGAYVDFGPGTIQGERETGLTAAKPDSIAVMTYHINPAGKDGAVPGSAAGRSGQAYRRRHVTSLDWTGKPADASSTKLTFDDDQPRSNLTRQRRKAIRRPR